MNVENVLRLADLIEADPYHFRMDHWWKDGDGGPARCIGGWAAHLWNMDNQGDVSDENDPAAVDKARMFLGVEEGAGGCLFGPQGHWWYKISAGSAAALLRDCAARGFFLVSGNDWDRHSPESSMYLDNDIFHGEP